ncbi:MAG: hypothetical protein QNJ89_05105 [Acidimicrobiia bacterium]|nr:hypothetical protein [Acidimicrobiia bacterium]
MITPDVPGAAEYIAGTRSFLAGLRPQDAVSLTLNEALDLMHLRFGDAVEVALSPEAVDMRTPLDVLPHQVQSPRAAETDSNWMRHTNMVGVNVRTVRDYGGVIKYVLTLPEAFDSIHLLPIWEPGVVESLYGIAGWNLNNQFYSDELEAAAPQLDSVEKQLRAVSNLLHVMGRTIGMDVIPHTDRFSEAALGSPDLFEWMRVRDRKIVDHSESLIADVVTTIFAWLDELGSAYQQHEVPEDAATLFALPEADRLQILFGDKADIFGRIERRIDLIKRLKWFGLEPVPATMGVPFRGMMVDPDPAHTVVDDYGMEWPDFVITQPEFMSRVFSPLARFKFYRRLKDNAEWEIDFSKPRQHVWDYVCDHYSTTQHIGNFDFMRGDMSHVQMRPRGVPDVVDEHYDILGTVKSRIQESVPWFGYFAETFLPARDVFQFGEELDHLDASLADATLGDLQSTVVGSEEFLRRFRRYLDDLATRRTAPAFGVMTADKDDPRFDEFYRAGNEVRMFTALFLPDMPSYTGLGFEIRDIHWEPVENERYTKLFVFREHGESNVYPSKARKGDHFIWGENRELFDRLTALRVYAEGVLDWIAESTTHWLIPPDATTHRGIAAWTQVGESHYVFVVNYDLEKDSRYFGIPGLADDAVLEAEFSTHGAILDVDRRITSNGFFHRIENLSPGEGRAYWVRPAN